uniref:Uncharacterized protein n=1 Tax=Meloidogyne enterolobii TaxID=390850 RepID=A0A6V7WAH7_MELEN|nr:unnamed protein product [Meloidogyne enterolobii]
MVQQQQHKMTSGKATTPANKHNDLLFLVVNCIQILCVLIVLMQALSTTELRGNFYYADRANIRKMLLESDGLRCKEFVIYNAEPPTPQEKWDEHLSNSGYATLKDREERSEGSKDHPPSSGRILTILERSLKVTGDEVNSTTGELKMRISLLFEWKTGEKDYFRVDESSSFFKGHGQLDVLQMPEDVENLTESILRESPDIASLNTSLPNITSTDKGTANTAKIPLPSVASAANSEETEEVEEKGDPANSDNQIQPRFPNGTHAYKINKMEGMQENKPADVFDPFNHVAKHLLVYTLASFLHLILQFCRCALSDNNGRYSVCELIFLVVSIVVWGIMLVLTSSTSMNWDSLWMCTNFRPEKPKVFIVAVICSAVLVVLYLFEALYACEMMFVEEATKNVKVEGGKSSEASSPPKNNNAIVAASTDDTTSTSILLPFTVHGGKIGSNIQQAKLVREDFCMITVKEN